MFSQTYTACKAPEDRAPEDWSGKNAALFRFCRWWPWPLTVTFKLVQARDQTRLPCEFGANLFNHSRDIWVTNKKNPELNMFFSKHTPHASPKNHTQQGLNGGVHCCCCLQWLHTIRTLLTGDGSAKCIFCLWWPWPLILTLKLVPVRDQTRLQCKSGANPFTGCRDIGAVWCSMTQLFFIFVDGDLRLWPWHSNSSK